MTKQMECLQNVYGPQQTLYPLLSPLKLNIKISFVLIKLQMILQIKSDKYLIRWFYFWRNSLLAVTKDNGTGSQEGRLESAPTSWVKCHTFFGSRSCFIFNFLNEKVCYEELEPAVRWGRGRRQTRSGVRSAARLNNIPRQKPSLLN